MRENIKGEKPLFSVLIANYNNGKYLKKAVNSVYRQTYDNWEIIIVDDCSTDDSKTIYEELSFDNRIRIFYNETNKGVGYTKHRAAELAEGEIAGALDPDDELEPRALELEAKIHMKHPEVSIVYSKVLFCDMNGNVVYKGHLPPFKSGETYFDHRWHGAMNFASFKMSYYNMTEGFGSDLRAGDDQDLYFKMEEVGKFYCLDEFTYRYFDVPNSLSSFSNYSAQWYGDLKARYRTCVRRKINPDDIIPIDLNKLFDDYAKQIVGHRYSDTIEQIVQERLRNEVYNKELQIRSSASYRLGHIILKPVFFLKKIIKK